MGLSIGSPMVCSAGFVTAQVTGWLHWMIFLPSSVMTDFLVNRDDLIISVDFVKGTQTRHSHQLPPRFCGRLWRVMRTIEDKKFSKVACDSWGSAPNLMYSGSATCNVATWRVLINGVNGMTLGFPAIFQFPWIFGFKNFSFPSLYFLLWVLFFSFIPAIAPTLLRWRFFFEFSWLQSFYSSRYATLFFLFCSPFLNNLLMSSWFSLCP